MCQVTEHHFVELHLQGSVSILIASECTHLLTTLCTHLTSPRALDISRIDGASLVHREKKQILFSYPDKNLGYSPPPRAITDHPSSLITLIQSIAHSPIFVAFDYPSAGASSTLNMGG